MKNTVFQVPTFQQEAQKAADEAKKTPESQGQSKKKAIDIVMISDDHLLSPSSHSSRKRSHRIVSSDDDEEEDDDEPSKKVHLRFRRDVTTLCRSTCVGKLRSKQWSSLVKEESLACQITTPFNNKLGCF